MGRTSGGGGIVQLSVSSVAGLAQVNLGSGDISTQMTMNVFNSAINIGFNGTTKSTPACLDAFGIPVRNFTGTVDYFLQANVASTNGPWVLSWPAARSSFTLQIQSSVNVSAHTNCTFNNGAGSGNLQVIGDGTNAGSITFTFVSAATTNIGTISFFGTDQSPAESRWASNAGGAGKFFSLVRSSDVAAYAGGTGQYWTSEFISLIKNLNPRSIRPMGWNLPRGSNVDSNETLWAYRNTVSQQSWFAPSYPPTTWSGGPGTSGAISQSNGNYTASAATDTTASGWADGEMIMGVISTGTTAMTVTGAASNGGNLQLTVSGVTTAGMVASQKIKINGVGGSPSADGFHTVASVDSGTTFTVSGLAFGSGYTVSGAGVVGYQQLSVTGKTSGTRLILNVLGQAIGFGSSSDQTAIIVSSASSIFVYDKVLDCVLYGDGGLSPQPPVEAQAQLAKNVGCRLWYNLPTWATDGYVTSALNAIFANFNGVLELEYGNEVWNFAFVGAQWATQRGVVLGITNVSSLPYQSLQHRRIMGNLVPGSSYGSAMQRINRLYMCQGNQDLSGTGSGDFNGANLPNPNSAGNAAYIAFVGSSGNYTSFPNRPIDVCDSMGFAPYFDGICIDPDSGGFSVNSKVRMQAIIDNTHTGNTSAASADIDDIVRQGTDLDTTFSASGTTFTTTANPNHFVTGDQIIFKGTSYANINQKTLYQILSVSGNTFTCGQYLNGSLGSAINPGAGSGGTVGKAYQNTVYVMANLDCSLGETVAASYDSQRTGGGIAKLNVQMYEGGGDMITPTTAQCTTLGLISPNPGGTAAQAAIDIAQAVINWKSATFSKQTYIDYYRMFFGKNASFITSGAMPHSAGGSHLTISGAIGGGGGEFSLCADNNPSNPQPYQWYYGLEAFNNGA